MTRVVVQGAEKVIEGGKKFRHQVWFALFPYGNTFPNQHILEKIYLDSEVIPIMAVLKTT